MGKEKEKSRITIHLDAPYVLLRGTSGAGANDVEPGFLSGQVCLHLAESTDLRAVTLHLRGKATPPSVLVCSHDWSFLYFNDHPRTLKAGKHVFPFSLTIPPVLPSSVSADLQNVPSFSGTRASISYKLRATAVRPSFSFSHLLLQHNLTTTHPVYLIRAPSPESLEYQQSVEVENTWPDKLMYSIALPHKAWAAGDTILAVLRFSPLAKGVSVESVLTTLWEGVEVLAAERKVVHQESRIIRCVKHEIVNGRAVRVDLSKPPKSSSSSSSQEEFTNNDVLTYITFPLPPMPYSSKPNTPVRSNPSTRPSSPTTDPLSVSPPLPNNTTLLSPTPPLSPTHHLPPLYISHRLRFSILIHNRDGHTSELRCSLPVNILDGKLLLESREGGGAALGARRVCLEGVVGGRSEAESEEGEDDLTQVLGFSHVPGEELAMAAAAAAAAAQAPAGVGDRDLPSYNAHLRDRVAVPGMEMALRDVESRPTTTTSSSSAVQVEPLGVTVVEGANSNHQTSAAINQTQTRAQIRSLHLNLHPHPEASISTSSSSSTSISSPPSPSRLVRRPSQVHVQPSLSPSTPTSSPPPSSTRPLATAATATASSSSGGSLSRLVRRHSHSHSHGQGNVGHTQKEKEKKKRPSTASGVVSRAFNNFNLGGGGGLMMSNSSSSSSSGSSLEGEGNGGARIQGQGQGQGGQHVRNLSSLIKATMRPFASLGLNNNPSSLSTSMSVHGQGQGQHHGLGLGHTSSSSPVPATTTPFSPHHHHANSYTTESTNADASASSSLTTTTTTTTSTLSPPVATRSLSSSSSSSRLSQVPTYSTASLATYLGGVQPLSSLVGLPSYDECCA